MAILLPLAIFAAIAVFATGSSALDSSDLLMRDAKNATELFEIAKKDMENWTSTYLQAIKEFHEKLLPEYVCPDVSARLEILTELEEQIEKIRECRQEKFEQLDVLKGIADTMGSLNKTESLNKLEDTIGHLNNTAHAEDIELKKEEDTVMKLKVTIENYPCDCAYNNWGHWGSCSKTCGDDGIKSRSRDVKWHPRNGGKECLEAEKESFYECNRKCCPIDCTWEEWSEWSSCPDVCGISRVFRSREKNEHICGGVACTGKSSDKKNCDRFADLKMENDICQRNFFNSTEEIERLKKKLCQNVLCHNGGSCQEGDCICPDGFNGRTCAENIYKDELHCDVTKCTATAYKTCSGGDLCGTKNGISCAHVPTGLGNTGCAGDALAPVQGLNHDYPHDNWVMFEGLVEGDQIAGVDISGGCHARLRARGITDFTLVLHPGFTALKGISEYKMDFYGYDENDDYYQVGDYHYLHQADQIYLFCPNTNTNTHANF